MLYEVITPGTPDHHAGSTANRAAGARTARRHPLRPGRAGSGAADERRREFEHGCPIEGMECAIVTRPRDVVHACAWCRWGRGYAVRVWYPRRSAGSVHGGFEEAMAGR